jgi:hypothetical protein
MRSLPVLALMLTTTPLSAQFDEPMRQHEAHVHGEATGSLSLDARTLTLSLELPAYNLIGFEHAPDDANQQAVLDRTLAHLQSLAWLNTADEGGCSPSRVEIGTPGLDGDSQHAHHDGHDHDQHGHEDDHDHHHDEHHDAHHEEHDHDHHHDGDSHDHSDHHAEGHHDHDHGGHASFDVQVELDCGQVSALRWVDVDLFADYPNNQLIRVDVLTETRVMQIDLGPDRTRIDLAP